MDPLLLASGIYMPLQMQQKMNEQKKIHLGKFYAKWNAY